MSAGTTLLSVCMITYNHEPFIAKSIDSVIGQKTNFSFEVIIGEDCSKDNTLSICQDYEQKHPHIITLIKNKSNKGIVRNFVDTLMACNGKYIAICEGDDYWTSADKLQKQVEFLEANIHYSACAHQAEVVYENCNVKPHTFNNIIDSRDFCSSDLVELRKFHTASFVFRANIIQKIDDFPLDITSADRALFLLCTLSGPIRFMPEVMCAYRKNDAGISSRITIDQLKNDRVLPGWLKRINKQFPQYRFRSYIYYTLFVYPASVTRRQLIQYYLLYAFYSFSYFPFNLKRILRSFRHDVIAKL